MRLLLKLLRKNVNVWQLVGFAFANLVGAIIVLMGIQAYKDAESLVSSQGSLLSSNVIVLSKPVSEELTLGGLLGADKPEFTQEEIDELSETPGVIAAAPFLTSEFGVYGSVTFGGFTASTEMFLEAVPDEFLDVDIDEWSADIGDSELPIILPKTYINFYNYGFAAARGTPQIGEALLSHIPITFVCRGPAGRRYYNATIVGFTDRINTILVPEEFLAEANRRFSSTRLTSVSRVVVKTDVAEVAGLMDHITEKGYMVDGDGEDSMRMLSVVRTVISVVVAIGLLVSALSFFLLLISIVLLIEKNRYQNETLSQIGYSRSRIALPYQLLVLVVDVAVWLIAFVITAISYPVLSELMASVSADFVSAGMGVSALAASVLLLFFAFLHALLIRFKIK